LDLYPLGCIQFLYSRIQKDSPFPTSTFTKDNTLKITLCIVVTYCTMNNDNVMICTVDLMWLLNGLKRSYGPVTRVLDRFVNISYF
jgi:hypothetical protein